MKHSIKVNNNEICGHPSNQSVITCLSSIIEQQEKQINELSKLLKTNTNSMGNSKENDDTYSMTKNYFAIHDSSELQKKPCREEYSQLLEQNKTLMYVREIFKSLHINVEDYIEQPCKKELNHEQIQENELIQSNDIRFKILEALEADRKRIARDLHDSTVQLLTMLVHKAELCEKLVSIDTVRTKMELHSMMLCLKESINELRGTIYNLRPMAIDDLGLLPAIEQYIKFVKQNSPIEFIYTVTNRECNIHSIVQLSIYRIIQEACSNIIKHACASEVLIDIAFTEDDQINIVIRDNGVGMQKKPNCDYSNDNQLDGLGLAMLKERVYLLYGTITIDSNCSGTTMKITIPIMLNERENYE